MHPCLRLRGSRSRGRYCFGHWRPRRSRLGGRLGRLSLLAGGDDGVQRRAFHARHELDDPGIAYILNEAIDDGVAQLAVSHLTALEPQGRFHLVAVCQKADCLVLLRLVVVLVHGDGKLHLFDDNDLLLLSRRTIALVLLVEKLAVVLNPADRRNCVGRNFNQIEATLAGNLESFKWGKDTELISSVVDDADFACADLFVDTNE